MAFRAEPTYRASLSVLVEPRPTQPVQTQNVYDPGIGTDEYFGTQYQILRSRSLASKVIDKLDLLTYPEFVGEEETSSYQTLYQRLGDLIDVSRWLPFLPAPEETPVEATDPEELRDKAIKRFRRALSVEPKHGSQIIDVHFESSSPQIAAIIANAVGEAYIESGLERRLDAAERASSWLTNTLSELREDLQQSESSLQQYRERQGLVDAGGMRRLLEEEVAETSQRLREARRQRSQLSNTYWRIQQAGNDPGRLEDISTILLDPLVQSAQEDVLEARSTLRQARERYGSRHPELSSARAEMENAEASYHNQLRIAAEGVRAEFEIARQNERSLEQSLEEAKVQLRELDRQSHQASMIQRDVETNRELYDMFLTRFRETDTVGEYEPINARIIDAATAPREPHTPRKLRIIMLGGIAGLFLGLILAVARHLLDEGIRAVEDMEQLSGLPVLGILPEVSGALGRRINLPQYFSKNPRKPYSEGVRSIRANIQLNDLDHSLKRLLVTSSMPGEGKTSLAGCLALALGKLEKVILVEADLRAPTLGSVFEVPKEHPGLIEVLMGHNTLEEALFQTDEPGVRVLRVKKPPKNPSEIVASQAFTRLLEQLAELIDRVIVDSPPCQAASDAAVLARNSDAVLFVLQSESTNRRAVKAAFKQLRQVEAPVIGSIINQVDVRKNSDYYGGYYYAYGYYGKG